MFIGFEDFELAIRALLNNIPVKAKLIDDIDLVHDHRVVKKSEDKNAVKERYNENHIEKSVKRIEDKFNIKFKASWRRRHKNQLKIILKGKDLSFIIFNFLSNTKSWFFDKVFSCR
jgi:excinuclease UvrABC ATPase subunit